MSASALTLTVQALAYSDIRSKSNPTRKPIDWRRPYTNLPFENASTESIQIDPGASLTLNNSARSLAVDNTTSLHLRNSLVDPTRYRLTWVGGTDPGFRTDRNLALNGIQLTLTLGANLTLTVQAPSGTPFASVQIGDVVFIPGTSTGDPASPFSPLNEGLWNVLSTDAATTMVLARAEGTVFSGTSETVTPSDNTSLYAFAASGAQVGDTVDISAGFAVPTQRSFEVVAVTSRWLEFTSTSPLGSQTASPGAAGLAIYASAKRFVMIETDQEVAIRMNGGTDSTNRISPVIPGEGGIPGMFLKFGPVWALTLVNRSTVRANLMVATAE